MLTFILALFNMAIFRQIKGIIVDGLTEEGISNVSIIYEGLSDYTISDSVGAFQMGRKEAHRLKVSAIGYKTAYIHVGLKTPNFIKISLSPDIHEINEVKVIGRHSKYSRKNNPAVELMRRVINKKKINDILYSSSCSCDSYNTYVIESKPYIEFVLGVSNIFKFFEIDYVRRLTYTQVKSKNGIRFAVNINF